MAIWQPNFRKDNPSTTLASKHADRAHFEEGETLLLRNSIEEEEEEEEGEEEEEDEDEEEEEEEEDEDISKSYITNGTHPPAPPDR